MNKLTKYRSGRDLLSRWHDDIDRLLTPLSFDWQERPISDWIPSVDVEEKDNQFILKADVPGVKADDIEVHMENGLLTIKGKRESEKKEEDKNYLRIERSSGSFMRQLSLPESVDQDKIQAKCSGGVLEVILPKASKNGGRKIQVTGE